MVSSISTNESPFSSSIGLPPHPQIHNAPPSDNPGLYGCRARRSAVDTVGVTIAQTQEAWSRGCITGALLMDVASTFSSVARGCLLRKMRNMGLGECLVKWTDSFMQERRAIMSADS